MKKTALILAVLLAVQIPTLALSGLYAAPKAALTFSSGTIKDETAQANEAGIDVIQEKLEIDVLHGNLEYNIP